MASGRPETPPLPQEVVNDVLRQVYTEVKSMQPNRKASGKPPVHRIYSCSQVGRRRKPDPVFVDLALADVELEHRLQRQAQADRDDWYLSAVVT